MGEEIPPIMLFLMQMDANLDALLRLTFGLVGGT
jgi:hypothetical protein